MRRHSVVGRTGRWQSAAAMRSQRPRRTHLVSSSARCPLIDEPNALGEIFPAQPAVAYDEILRGEPKNIDHRVYPEG